MKFSDNKFRTEQRNDLFTQHKKSSGACCQNGGRFQNNTRSQEFLKIPYIHGIKSHTKHHPHRGTGRADLRSNPVCFPRKEHKNRASAVNYCLAVQHKQD